jgi:hypothetical protein
MASNQEAIVSSDSRLSVAAAEIRRIEMRTGPRHRILQRCFATIANAAASDTWRSISYNISATGIGITLPLKLRVGTLLTIQAWGLPRACTLQVRIAHAREVDFVWFTGCEFSKRLSNAQLQVWQSGPLDWLDDRDQ